MLKCWCFLRSCAVQLAFSVHECFFCLPMEGEAGARATQPTEKAGQKRIGCMDGSKGAGYDGQEKLEGGEERGGRRIPV